MNTTILRGTLLAIATAVSFGAGAADQPPASSDQVVVPQVDRRDVKVPRFASNDFELGAFVGTYATQNFGTSAVAGLRAGYHITEDFFVEGVLAQTKVSDEMFRQVLPGGIFPDKKEKLTYYNLSAGYNVLPGEIFIGGTRAKPSQFYLIGGVGSTKFDQQRRPTMNVGFGLRVYLIDRVALQVDMRDHIFSLDLLGKRQSTQNLELTGGLAVFF
ncbi:MAG TPA: outer membrane beta-barrel domain-containing protein [Caldimonas sp.]